MCSLRAEKSKLQLFTEGLPCPGAQVGSGEAMGVSLLGEKSNEGRGGICFGLIVFLQRAWETPITAPVVRCPVNQFSGDDPLPVFRNAVGTETRDPNIC